MSFDPAFLGDIRRRTRLSELVAARVPLVRRGGELVGRCPFHDEKTPSFTVVDAKGFYHCFGCGAHGDAISWAMQTTAARDFVSAVEYLAGRCGLTGGVKTAAPAALTRAEPRPGDGAQLARQRARAKALFLAARPLVAGDPVWRYLASRGIDLARLPRRPRALRFAPDCWDAFSGRAWPALLGAVVDGTGALVATHRTFLEERADGAVGKAPVTSPKMALGSYVGGTIRLARGASGRPWRAAPAGEEILAAEGIEDALTAALWLPERRAVAVVALGNLARVVLPAGAGILWLQQNDPPGSGAARQLARAVAELRARGTPVRLLRAPCFAKDANEFQQRLAAAA